MRFFRAYDMVLFIFVFVTQNSHANAADCGSYTCTDSFYSVSKGSSVTCGNDNGCDVETCCQGKPCGFAEWGTGLPFAPGGQVAFDGHNINNIKMSFKLETPACLDRRNWLDVTYHALGTPICEKKTRVADTECS